MRKGKHAVIGLLVILLIGLLGTVNKGIMPKAGSDSLFVSPSNEAQQGLTRTDQTERMERIDAFTISATPNEGVLDPIRIKQSGYQTTEGKRGRTDTGSNTQSNIAIDDANGWFMNSTSIDVWNLQRLYGLNGTFDAGTDPWTNYTLGGGGSSIQLASYNSTGKYIECTDVAEWGNHPPYGQTYKHFPGEIGFSQVIYNVPSVSDFKLEFDYRYAAGPLDPQDNDSLSDIGVFWQLEKDLAIVEAWYTQIQLLDSHDGWYHISHVFDPIDPGWSDFAISLGLYFPSNVIVDNATDYDDDSAGDYDGLENMQNVTLQLDNIVFTSIAAPTPEEVELTFHAGSFSSPISNGGTASISNPSFWTTNPLQVEVTSNTSVIFSYTVTSFFHRYINSSWTTDLSEQGVQYSVAAGQSSDLSLFTYMTGSVEYDGATVDLLYPTDWENVTILDPLTNDITSLCSVSPGIIHIPTSETDRSGWWEINLQAPNYAQNVSIQVQDGGTGQWSESSLFKPGNTTRAQVEIGTAAGSPTDGSPVNITWILPNSTQWAYDSVNTMINGFVNSSHWTLGGANTSAGQWEVTALWSNGTEVAYDYAVFDMYHTASLTPRETLVNTDTGLLITNMLYYMDDDTSDFILDASALVVGNWSSMFVNFLANPVFNWWQADFDTNLVGAGEFVVIVNASRPYYDDVSCQFTIVSTLRTNFELTSVGPLPTEVGLYQEFSVEMRYELKSGAGVDGATIQMNYTGPQGGLQLLGQSTTGPGDYSINITSSKSGTYTVIITASKAFHYSNSDSFTLIVGEVGTILISLNGTSDVSQMGEPYRLVVQYRNSTGYGLAGANVSVTSINPASGLNAGLSTDEGNGYYSIVLTSSTARTYTLFINANMTNHVSRIIAFTITVIEIPTVLTADSAGTTLSVGDSQSVELSFRDESSTGIPGATISVLNPPAGLSFQIAELSGGLYNVTITPLAPGTYQIALKASKTNYLNSTLGYTIIVRGFATVLVSMNGTSDVSQLGAPYRYVVQYRNGTGYGLAGANVSVIGINPSSGLIAGLFFDEGSGYYSVVLTSSAAQTYTIFINANMTDHVTQTTAFTITVNEIPTILTADSAGATLSVGDSQSIELSFRDESSTGIVGASISVLIPPAGLFFEISELSGGLYNVTITAITPGTYQMAFKASKTNYLNSTLGYTVIVRGFGSNLIRLNGTADFAYFGDTYRLVVQFTNTTGFGLGGASVSVIDVVPAAGLGIADAVDEGSGFYSIDITASSAGIFTILLRANLTDYDTQFASFGLTVREIPTILTLDTSGATISVDQSHDVQVTFRDDALNGLIGATILVLHPPSGLANVVVEGSGGQYTITLTPSVIGTYEFAIRATLLNYLNSTVGFTLVVRSVPTELRIVEELESDSIYFTDEYNLTLLYVRTDTGQNVSSADLTITTLPAEGLTVLVSQIGDLYFLGFEAQSIGKWQVFFTANKTDHVIGFIEFELEVLPVAIEIDIFRGLSAVEGSQITLSLWLTESVTGDPVTGATVEYQLISETGPGEIQPMSETEPGLYSASFQMPSYESTTYVRIYVAIENYEIDADYYEAQLEPLLSEIEALNRTITRYSPFIAIMGVVAIGVAGRRAYTRRQRRRYIEAMVVKRRFDDVKSLLGVIVLHKNTGIPIYSKMLKEGLDELLLSGFVSAISTFRNEFNVSQENWVVTPISDIIRTVATENLLCAFISLAPPSKGQELRMVEFAEAIGFVFDHMYPEVPLTVLEPETEAQFNAFFDDIMDGRFLRDYTVSEGKTFPRKTKCIEERIHRIDDEDGFDLEELAKEMTSCGFEEARVYTIIMDAIEMGNLALASIDEVRADATPPPAEEPKMEEVEPDIVEADPEPEVVEPPTIKVVRIDEPVSEKSDEEKFLEDVESLLSKENEEEKEE
ncbi:MAG: hypothetical protein ACFFAD_05450 [Candidatus Hermodarchaeota archaeon]